MKKPKHPAIRELLKQHPDGLTAIQITEALGIGKQATTRKCLEAMPDVYVDRWTKQRNSRGQYLAIWVRADIPANCPYPTDRFEKPKTVWVTP